MKQNDEMMTKCNEHCDLKHLAFKKKNTSRVSFPKYHLMWVDNKSLPAVLIFFSSLKVQ